ncbi:MAG: GTP-binding protein, partial [Deltaproteobacteria bacterium]|nr:GTP-binding protein [Deltaproteobacteria bacterium]
MNVVESGKLRNVAVVGHGHTGKTSLVEAILFDTGATNRLGRVEDGNTVTDFEPEEKSKLYSIATSLAACNWNKHRINLLDTPGGANFVTEAFHALDVADAALLTVCAASGVEVQTEKLWDAAEKRGMPRAFFVNKLDRERANFDQVLRDLHDSFKINVV